MLESLVELVARFVVEFLFYTISYGIGRVMLKTATLGHYPPFSETQFEKEPVPKNRQIIGQALHAILETASESIAQARPDLAPPISR